MAGTGPCTDTITGDVMRFREVSGPEAKPGTIEVHIIRPGWGSSGYYFEEKLKKACENGVYPVGMHMHWDHPTPTQEFEQPARTTGTIAAVLTEQGHYLDEGDSGAWDGPGVYAMAEVRPKFQEDLKWLAGKIGVSHYVEGTAGEGVAPDGKKGRIITELIPSPFNSVDFVTIPGAGGHSRFNEVQQRESNASGSMEDIRDRLHIAVRNKFGETGDGMEKYGTWIIASYPDHCVFEAPDGMNYDVPYSIEEDGSITLGEPKPVEITYQPKESRMTPGKQLSIRLSEIMTNDPEVVAEIRKQVAEDLQIESQTEAQKKKMAEAETRIKTLEVENKDLRSKIAEKAAREFVTTEVSKANLPESVGKVLTESLVKQAVLAEDGSIDAVKFGLIVSEAIKAKQAEIADILRESGASGVHDNGPITPGNAAEVQRAREEYRNTLVENGMSTQQANRLAGIEVA